MTIGFSNMDALGDLGKNSFKGKTAERQSERDLREQEGENEKLIFEEILT